MQTLKEFIDSDIYLELIQHFDNKLIQIADETKAMEIVRLKDRLKQRQFLLEGSNCTPYPERELVTYYLDLIKYDKDKISLWVDAFSS